jgi:hypothetical protein
MLRLSEISDRFEIQQLLVDYSTAIDQRRFDDLDGVFTPDAYIDYRATIRRSRAGWPRCCPPSRPMRTCWATSMSTLTVTARRATAGAVLRAVVRRRVRPDARGLADEPPVESKCFDKVV